MTNYMRKEERYHNVLSYFRENMQNVTTELNFGDTFQLLIATMLSAQCTDKRVNMVTPFLFDAYPDAVKLAQADVVEVYELIKSISYPNSKAKHLVETSRMIVSDFGGEVPDNIEDLTKLPGVGRKTANVVLAVAFEKSAMPVDTHVFRVSHRLGLVSSKATTPIKVEQELRKNIPEYMLSDAHHWLILHGRYVCKSRKPECEKCPFGSFCPKKNV